MIRRCSVASAVALGAVALAAALPVASPAQVVTPDDRRPVEGRALLTPRIVLFGDTVQARVDVVFDRDEVDPDSIRISTSFSPWEIVRAPERTRRDAGSTTYLSTIYAIRCLTGPCVPGTQSAALEFDPARVSYASATDTEERASIPVQWPLLTVYSRFASSSADARQSSSSPWRAELVAMPDVSHRLAPGLLVGLSLALGAALALAGLALLYLARPRRLYEPPPEPEPEPLPQLTPLELALELLEDSARADGAEERRRALELVAEALEERGNNSSDLVRSARTLAWSEDDPAVEDTSGIAAQVRTIVEDEAAEEDAAAREREEVGEHVV